MSQQGERPADQDDWWGRLYDEDAGDTATSGAHAGGGAGDSLDERFDSAAKAVGGVEHEGSDEGSDEAAPSAPAPLRAIRTRAPWEPPEGNAPTPGSASAGPPDPRTFTAPTASTAPPSPADPPTASAPPSPGGPATGAERTAGPEAPESADPATVPAAPSIAAPAAGAEPPMSSSPSPSADAAELDADAPDANDRPAPLPPLPRRPVAGRPADAVTTVPAQARAEETEAGAGAGAGARQDVRERESAAAAPRPVSGHVGDRPPTYDAEPSALPSTVPQELDGLVAADTVLDGARYGTYTLRAASVRGDSARFRGEHRRDALLTARFGTDRQALVLVAVATGVRTSERAHLAAADVCRWIGGVIGRSHLRLSEDIRAGRRDALKSGLHRLTDRGFGRLRARAAELGLEPERYTAGLRCLLLSADPDCRTRIFFGAGDGGLFRLRDGVWQNIEPEVLAPAVPAGSVRAEGEEAESGVPSPHRESTAARSATEPFRFQASIARSGDVLLLCSPGFAAPLRGEPALAGELARRWSGGEAPGLAAFLTDTQLRVKGYSDDRTSAAVWEA
ncbi:protein phosphatase 2C domain-containing protein [Streptomyces sp. NPDC052042]|uniref:protein phosphatase 2C domain-containing protein n=1 Tax=Streptomyces sp. NPDC052042 TaxID=3365683 RepID=UPI0037CEA5F4